jgi:hypothetical protein
MMSDIFHVDREKQCDWQEELVMRMYREVVKMGHDIRLEADNLMRQKD